MAWWNTVYEACKGRQPVAHIGQGPTQPNGARYARNQGPTMQPIAAESQQPTHQWLAFRLTYGGATAILVVCYVVVLIALSDFP
jgi:hypothetical protein